jgi:hypothetical protein
MRPVRIIAAFVFAATVGTLTLPAAPAWAVPVAIDVSPSAVAAGDTVTITVSGAAGPDCADSVTLISKAFVHTHDFAGLPAVVATAKPGGVFTATTTIPRSKTAGTYTISGRCGGGNLGVSATLVVRAAPVAIHVSPTSVPSGGTVTLSGSVGPDCPGSVILISKAFVHTHDFAGLPAVFVPVEPGGGFSTTTRIPSTRRPGTYTITGRCGGGNLGVSATLVVRAAASPTTTPAPVPPPATGPPVIQPAVPAPAVTGPPAQPATSAAAQPASRWIIPGLAALGSGTLAALGGWLLYRRRHPAGPSRPGRSGMAH